MTLRYKIKRHKSNFRSDLYRSVFVKKRESYFFSALSTRCLFLFIDEIYPSTAVAFKDSKLIKISKEKFLKILDEYPFIQKQFLNLMAERIHTKAKTTKDIVNQKPEFRIIAFLNAHKNPNCAKKELVEFTRQEIANFTGLRVETVIRELSRLSKTDKVEIINHKLYY